MEEALQHIALWLQQPLATYWLAGSVSLLLLLLIVLSFRHNKRVRLLKEEREMLAIVRATNTQRIEQLESDRALLDTQVQRNAAQIQQMVAESAELKTSRDEKLTQLQDVNNERMGLREAHENNQRKIHRLESEIREQRIFLQSEQDKLRQIKSEFERQKTELKNEFKVVSETIIQERQEMLSKQNREGVGALLKPLQEQILGFQQRVNEVHDESLKGNSALKTEIENVRKMGIQMQEEAGNLTSALKGDSQLRGAWGEAQLERTLELSGLVQHDHYEKQSAFVDDEGRRKQTDYIIKLPGEKCIIIDSKVSLNAYERAYSSENTADVTLQALAMKHHVAAVRTHINELANKDYTSLSALHSPDFVLMFMPIEPAYIEAMKHDPELFAYGYNQNVILVSHTTLIPILRTVANLWMLDQSNKEARSIGEKANDIYNSVATVSERLESLGKALGAVSNHYNKTVTAISGNQGLQGKIKRFTELSSKASKTMPELEHKHYEFDVSKLNVEALPEPEQPELERKLEPKDESEPEGKP